MSDADALRAKIEERRRQRAEEEAKQAEEVRELEEALAKAERAEKERKEQEQREAQRQEELAKAAEAERVARATAAKRAAEERASMAEIARIAQMEADEAMASQVAGGRMDLDDPDDLRNVHETGPNQAVAWTIVGGAGRCPACVKAGEQCLINVGAIERWRKEFREGTRRSSKHPKGTNCRRCNDVLKQRCALPATEEMREGLEEAKKKEKGKGKEKAGSVTPSAASSSKRRMEFLGVEMPAPKRRRTEEGDWAVLAEALRRMEGTVAESSARAEAASDRLTEAIDRLTDAVAGQVGATNLVVDAIAGFFQGVRRKQDTAGGQGGEPGKVSGKAGKESEESEESEEESDESVKEVPIEDLPEGGEQETEDKGE